MNLLMWRLPRQVRLLQSSVELLHREVEATGDLSSQAEAKGRVLAKRISGLLEEATRDKLGVLLAEIEARDGETGRVLYRLAKHVLEDVLRPPVARLHSVVRGILGEPGPAAA
jgi:hypothetical protein